MEISTYNPDHAAEIEEKEKKKRYQPRIAPFGSAYEF